MINFDEQFFVKMDYPDEQIGRYFKSAEHNLRIAESVKVPEVTFKFSYDALIKLGITVCVSSGYKVKSRAGHHIKILETLSNILKDKEIKVFADVMRVKRNQDLYGDGVIISEKEANEYFEFVSGVFAKAKKVLFK